MIPNRIEIESITVYLKENLRIKATRERLRTPRKIPPHCNKPSVCLKFKTKIPFHILLLNRLLLAGAMGLVSLSYFLNPLASLTSNTKKLNSYKGVPYTMIIEGPMMAVLPTSRDAFSRPTALPSGTPNP